MLARDLDTRQAQQAADAKLARTRAELDKLKADLMASDDQEPRDRFT